MPAIRHTHRVSLDVPLASVRPVLDALWSGGSADPLPVAQLRPWRKLAPGASKMSVGTHFGHGPFRFEVERCDDEVIRARILTAGYRGWHGFSLSQQGARTLLVHDLQADTNAAYWLAWQLLIGAMHDWAVRTCLARIAALAGASDVPRVALPWQFALVRRVRRAFGAGALRA